jgi:predicted RNA-binding protein YlqC (UPF0109 family)
MLPDAVEHLIRGIVDHPEDVSVRLSATRRGRILQIRVHPEDMGRVIGRAGRTANAVRTVVEAIDDDQGPKIRVDFVDVAGR